MDGVCRVCGSRLSPPVVTCPQCATPHHADCWEYNRGCAIFGCNVALDLRSLATVEDRAPAKSGPGLLADPEARRRAAGVAVAVLCVAVVAGWKLVLALAGVALTAHMMGWEIPALTGTDSLPLPAEGGSTGLALEMKAVTALIGRGVTGQLAQAYALFEQRHPHDVLLPALQTELAVELLRGGYRVLGLEALEKAERLVRETGEQGLERLRFDALADDPAFAGEILADPLTGEVDRDLLARLGRLAAGCPIAGPTYLLSLFAKGWDVTHESHVRIPSDPEGRGEIRGTLLAGPLEPDEARSKLADLWRCGQPALPVPETALALSSKVERVKQLHLSQVAAVIVTEQRQLTLEWDDLTAAIYGRLAVVEKRRELESRDRFGLHGERTTTFQHVDKEEVHYVPVLEIHARSDPARFRIDAPMPDLFTYLGRRRDCSFAPNVVLVTKDVVRFLGSVRASHGLMSMMSERPGPASSFADGHKYEEYVLWFSLMGSPEALEAWKPLRDEARQFQEWKDQGLVGRAPPPVHRSGA